MRKETKPELVELDGNMVYDRDGHWVRDNPGSNVVMASNQLSPAVAQQNGTSFAAPRVSHKLALVLKDLVDLGITDVSAPLLKAFLVNSAKYRGDVELIKDIQVKLHSDDPKSWLHVLGYGFPDHVRATDCDDYSMILYHQGQLEANRVAYFGVPIPSVLSASPGRNRLTVTVAHYPDVQQWGLERYLGTDLKWRMFRGDVSRDDVIGAMSVDEVASNDDEADDNALPSELKFNYGIQRRSRGAVQHDIFEWTQHRGHYSESHYTLAVAASKRWNREVEPVPFAVVVRVEDLGRTAKVYTEILRLLAEIEVEARG